MKKILIAFALATLLFSCTAEGVFSGNSIDNPRVDWSNNDAPSSSSLPSLPSSSSSSPIEQFCYYYDSYYGEYACDAIPGYYSLPRCIDDYGSAAVIDRQTCQNRDAHIYE